MAEHAQRMAELEIKKQRIDLEAKGKLLEAEERRIIAQHQREREREQHDMQMLRLRMQYQAVAGHGVADAQFGMEQFASANTFGDTGDMGLAMRTDSGYHLT
jgi:hypothetical protein